MEIEYTFNIGDKLKAINSLVGETIGIITNKPSTRVIMTHGECINLEVIKSEAYETGDIIKVSCYAEFELLETVDKYIDISTGSKHKTMIKNKMIIFKKNNEVEGAINDLKSYEEPEKVNANKLMCKKDCIYPKGTIVDIINKFEKYVIVTDYKNKNVFTYEEIEEYFTEYIDLNKIKFKTQKLGKCKLKRNESIIEWNIEGKNITIKVSNKPCSILTLFKIILEQTELNNYKYNRVSPYKIYKKGYTQEDGHIFILEFYDIKNDMKLNEVELIRTDKSLAFEGEITMFIPDFIDLCVERSILKKETKLIPTFKSAPTYEEL